MRGCLSSQIPSALASAWEMCTKEGKSFTITFSSGFRNPKNAARFAVTSETGWVFA